jgi:hypothetical protein
MSDSKEAKNAGLLRETLSQRIFTDRSVVIATFGNLLNADVTPLVRCYHQTYSSDLLNDLKKKLRGDFQTLAIACATEVTEWDAKCIEKACRGLGTDEDVVSEVVCTRTDEELKAISTRYNQLFNEELKARLHSETGGNLRRVYETVLAGRSSTGDVPALVAQLYRAGEGKFGTDEKAFVAILAGHDRPLVRQIAEAYEKKHGKTLVKVIKSEFSGDLEKALIALTEDLPTWYAGRFRQYMTRVVGVDEYAVTRIIRARKEKDLPAISVALENLPSGKKQPLLAWISDKLSNGPYRRLLTCLATNFAGRAAIA